MNRVLAIALALLASLQAAAAGPQPAGGEPTYSEGDMKALIRESAQLFAGKQYTEALEKLRPLSEKAPQDKGVWVRRGFAEIYTEKPEDALASFDHVLAMDPNNVQALSGRGLTLYSLKRYDEATQALSRAAELKPKVRRIRLLLGSSLYYAGKPGKALEHYDVVLKMMPRDAGAWQLKGVALFRMNKFEEALKAFETASSILPGSSDAWLSKGSCLVKLGRTEEALAAYDRVVKINPLSPDLQYNRGIALETLGRSDEARIAFRRALALRPEFPAAKAALESLPVSSQPAKP